MRKSFPGATPKEFAHYCTHALMEGWGGKPGYVHNKCGHTSFIERLDIVKLCHSYGVNSVYVSSITYRPQHIQSVTETTDLLISYSVITN